MEYNSIPPIENKGNAENEYFKAVVEEFVSMIIGHADYLKSHPWLFLIPGTPLINDLTNNEWEAVKQTNVLPERTMQQIHTLVNRAIEAKSNEGNDVF